MSQMATQPSSRSVGGTERLRLRLNTELARLRATCGVGICYRIKLVSILKQESPSRLPEMVTMRMEGAQEYKFEAGALFI